MMECIAAPPVAIVPALQGQLHENAALQHYTSWRVGGKANKLYQPANIDDLAAFLRQLPREEELVWLGLGSNVLIRDAGITGTVIHTQGRLAGLAQKDDCLVCAEAGVSCATLARFCARNGLGGLEFLAGIPGTVGGALAMNAGCAGSETWRHVVAVETLDRQGHRHLRTPVDYHIGYRTVKGPPQEWFVAGHFVLEPCDPKLSTEKIKALLAHRTATQPTNEPNCGSVFRNPPGQHAGKLIEQCGLKGFSIGGASVSTKHANFIINQSMATAAEIEALIHHVANEVFKRVGIQLMPEVHILGGMS